MLFKNKISLKKIVSVSSIALALMGTGTVVSQGANSPIKTFSTAKAVTVTQSDVHKSPHVENSYKISDKLFEEELIANHESRRAVYRKPGHNRYRFHWYRKPVQRQSFPNMNLVGSSIDYFINGVGNGMDWVDGYVTINGQREYLLAADVKETPYTIGANPAVIDKKPKLYVGKGFTLYTPDDIDWGYARPAFKSSDSELNTVLVPYYHKPILVPNANTGKLGQYIPIEATVKDGKDQETEEYLITKSDFDKMQQITRKYNKNHRIYMIYADKEISEYHNKIDTSNMRHDYYSRVCYKNAYLLTRSKHHRYYQKKAERFWRHNVYTFASAIYHHELPWWSDR